MPPEVFYFQQVVLPILGMGMGALVLVGGYRLVARVVDRRQELRLAERGGGASEELQELRTRVEALEDQAGRVQELEERLDFAERLLTQGRHGLPEGSDSGA